MYQSILVVVLLVQYSHTQDANCDFYQNVAVGSQYLIRSPNYPYSYNRGTTCRWSARCPNGYNCVLECSEINLPQSPSCSKDRILISKTGSPQLEQADYYCGQGTLSVVSNGQYLTMALITSTNTEGGRFSCNLFAQVANNVPQQCSCGARKVNRIVGGQQTAPYEYPMMAGIVYVDQDIIRCGATIIAEKYVVTAAHCVAKQTLSNLNVVAGVYKRDDSPGQQRSGVASIKIHPQYNENTYDYDIAIIELIRKLTFNNIVGSACLFFSSETFYPTGVNVTILGWGTTSFGGPRSPVLRKAGVTVISRSSCRNTVSTVTDRQMCTFSPGKDSCQDDSGGPVLYTNPTNGLEYFLGIISFGQSCASNSPGVSTYAPLFTNWILQNAPADYCRK